MPLALIASAGTTANVSGNARRHCASNAARVGSAFGVSAGNSSAKV